MVGRTKKQSKFTLNKLARSEQASEYVLQTNTSKDRAKLWYNKVLPNLIHPNHPNDQTYPLQNPRATKHTSTRTVGTTGSVQELKKDITLELVTLGISRVSWVAEIIRRMPCGSPLSNTWWPIPMPIPMPMTIHVLMINRQSRTKNKKKSSKESSNSINGNSSSSNKWKKPKRNIGNCRIKFIESSERNGSTWMIRLIKSFKLLKG